MTANSRNTWKLQKIKKKHLFSAQHMQEYLSDELP